MCVTSLDVPVSKIPSSKSHMLLTASVQFVDAFLFDSTLWDYKCTVGVEISQYNAWWSRGSTESTLQIALGKLFHTASQYLLTPIPDNCSSVINATPNRRLPTSSTPSSNPVSTAWIWVTVVTSRNRLSLLYTVETILEQLGFTLDKTLKQNPDHYLFVSDARCHTVPATAFVAPHVCGCRSWPNPYWDATTTNYNSDHLFYTPVHCPVIDDTTYYIQ